MADTLRSSRQQYVAYHKDVVAKRARGEEVPPSIHHDRPRSNKRGRSFWRLFMEFWEMLGEHRRVLVVGLSTLGLSTLLGLIPLYGTKLVFDNVLGGKPLSPRAAAYLPSDPGKLLGVICIAMVALTIVSVMVGTSSRWQATRISKRVSAYSRKLLFDHAVRLPLHRVYDLKSGGVASILREDAGGERPRLDAAVVEGADQHLAAVAEHVAGAVVVDPDLAEQRGHARTGRRPQLHQSLWPIAQRQHHRLARDGPHRHGRRRSRRHALQGIAQRLSLRLGRRR